LLYNFQHLKQSGYIGLEQAIIKIRNYCAYQERSHQEVKEKLFSFGLYPDQVNELIAGLIQENFLNEERYAIAFAGGKFRIKGWGKQKIRYALRLQKVSDFCIRKGLNAIDDEAYMAMLKKLYEEKQKSVRSEKNMFIRMRKIRLFLQQRGFETELIQEIMK
jgi:regulatory protein